MSNETPYGSASDDRVAVLPDVADMKRMTLAELIDLCPDKNLSQLKSEMIYILQSYY